METKNVPNQVFVSFVKEYFMNCKENCDNTEQYKNSEAASFF